MKALLTILVILGTSAIALAGPLNPLAFTSSGVLDLSPGNYTINTGGDYPVLKDSNGTTLATGSFYSQGQVGFDPTVAVLDFSAINVPAGVTITVQGQNPLALLSRSSITFDGTITAIGGDGQPENGSGSAGGLGNVGGANGGNGGGGNHLTGWPGFGPGGGPSNGVYGLTILSFGVGGGYGGRGADNGDDCYTPGCSPRQSNTYGNLNNELLAGSGGSGSSWNILFAGVGGGGGGGAIEFVAETEITLAGSTIINANGGGTGSGDSWGGGGGSGGGLLFAAPVINPDNAQISAIGGSFSGGGGRVLFLTKWGRTQNIDQRVDVAGGCCNGETGTINYGILRELN
jgi:hypothetical protein